MKKCVAELKMLTPDGRCEKIFTWADPQHPRPGTRVWRYFPVIETARPDPPDTTRQDTTGPDKTGLDPT